MAKPKLTRKERLEQQADDEQQTTSDENVEQTDDAGDNQVDDAVGGSGDAGDEQTAEQTDESTAEQTDEQTAAATFAELHELAGDDSAFIVEQRKVGASIEQARAALVAHVKQQRDDAVEAKAAAEKQLADVKAAATIAGDAESDSVTGNADEGKRRGKFVDLINLRSAGDLN